VDLIEIGELGKGMLVAKRHKVETVVSKGAHAGKGSRLLSTARAGSGDEEAGILAPVAAGSPDATRLVPESLPLSREVAVTGRDTE
jgi:hypothetical protein